MHMQDQLAFMIRLVMRRDCFGVDISPEGHLSLPMLAREATARPDLLPQFFLALAGDGWLDGRAFMTWQRYASELFHSVHM
jgi:hypothetical protein